MNGLAAHKKWMTLCGIAFLLLAASHPLRLKLQADATQHLQDLRKEEQATRAALRQLDDDIKTAQELSQKISAEETRRLLAPVDRLQVSDSLEREAAENNLKNFSYTLAPEQPVRVTDNASGTDELAQSVIQIKTDAPSDTAIYGYIENLSRQLPGRVSLKHLTLNRPNETIGPTNIHAEIILDWLSGGTTRQVVEQ